MGAAERDVVVADVPGAFELPLAAAVAARSGRFDAIVALGAVIKGETDHYDHVAREASTRPGHVARETGVPVGFGLLTVVREEQALSRSAAGPDNKGAEAARAAVAMVHVLRPSGVSEAHDPGSGGARGRPGGPHSGPPDQGPRVRLPDALSMGRLAASPWIR